MTLNLLDEANIRLYTELASIKGSLDIYRLIGLNTKSLNRNAGKEFFGFVQSQSLKAVFLGLSKVFESNGRYKLCSIDGVYDLAKGIDCPYPQAARQFVETYGISYSSDWKVDVAQVLTEQRKTFKSEIDRMKELRDQKFAHMDQAAPESSSGPCYDSLERMIQFADDFHSFINAAFKGGYAEPIANYVRIENSLASLLKHMGVQELVTQVD